MGSMTEAKYAARAGEYAALFGTMKSVHPSDAQLVRSWAEQAGGALLDAGCGPGHWTAYLSQLGHDIEGMDQVTEFIEHARDAHPGVAFRVGNIDESPFGVESLDGVLAWYSVIHHAPGVIQRPLSEIARFLRPGGLLLVGFFTGSRVVAFDHAVVTAYLWPPEALASELNRAGFEVMETHTRVAPESHSRPHGAILARRVGAVPSDMN